MPLQINLRIKMTEKRKAIITNGPNPEAVRSRAPKAGGKPDGFSGRAISKLQKAWRPVK